MCALSKGTIRTPPLVSELFLPLNHFDGTLASLVICHMNLVAILPTGQEIWFVKKTVGIAGLPKDSTPHGGPRVEKRKEGVSLVDIPA